MTLESGFTPYTVFCGNDLRLAIYSSRFASWQDCTVLSVDYKKGLHSVKYEETGVQKWHKLSDNQVCQV